MSPPYNGRTHNPDKQGSRKYSGGEKTGTVWELIM